MDAIYPDSRWTDRQIADACSTGSDHTRAVAVLADTALSNACAGVSQKHVESAVGVAGDVTHGVASFLPIGWRC